MGLALTAPKTLMSKIAVPDGKFFQPIKKRVLIGMPFGRCLDLAPHLACVALVVRASANPDYDVFGKYDNVASVDVNRDSIAQASLDKACDWCLMVDTDMSYPDTLLETLISRDKDVIGVPYYTPRWERNKEQDRVGPIVYDYDKEKQAWHKWWKIEQTQPFKVDGVGAAILLVKTTVFRKLEKPWFPFIADFSLIDKNKREPRVMSEDLGFCRRCMGKGIEVWVDPTFGDSIKHWKAYGYSKKDCTEK